MQTIKSKQKSIYKLLFIILMVTSFTLLMSRPPYFVITPGEVNSTQVFIHSEYSESEHSEQAIETDYEHFYYTTVLLADTDWYGVAKASLQPHHALVSKKQLLAGKTLNEYIARSELTMKQSLSRALEAAYTYLQIPYNKEAKEIYVSKLSNNRNSLFNEADQIKAIVIDEETIAITDATQLVNKVNEWANLDAAYYTLIVETQGEERHIKVEHPSTANFPLTKEELAKLYNVANFNQLYEVIAENESQRLSLENQQIGGPSAGLIMALTFINALQDEMIETSYNIAATGSIEVNGQVGIIGSIKQKVVTIDKAGIDLFLVPKEQEVIAKKKAKSIDSAVTIIGVTTLSEAIDAINQYKTSN